MQAEITVLLSAMQEAGDTILQIQRKGFTVEKKSNRDHDQVTEADLAANALLKQRLMAAFPDYGWLSEESQDDFARLNHEKVWIVDPIDGTLEFAAGIPEYAVSVALAVQGEVLLAAVLNPSTKELFHAVKNQGAWLNGQRIYCRPTQDPPVLLASRSEYRRGEWEQFKSSCQIKPIGSIAYKLALVAAGQADATFSLGPKNEWDIAAGCLLVTEAQGVVTDKEQKCVTFNHRDVLINSIVASSAMFNQRIFDLIHQSGLI